MECDGVAVAVVVVEMGKTQKREDARRGERQKYLPGTRPCQQHESHGDLPPILPRILLLFSNHRQIPRTPLHNVVHTQKRTLGGNPMFGGAAIPTPTRSKLAVLFEAVEHSPTCHGHIHGRQRFRMM